MKAGGRGWVIKSEAANTLVDAVHDALGGETETASDSGLRRPSRDDPSPRARPGARELSLRERQVLRLLSEGKSNKEIGVALGIAMKTVETHRTHITEKLRLRGLANLVRYAIRNRILEP
jgi:DNA-binding NarL/FixJ family response regulator